MFFLCVISVIVAVHIQIHTKIHNHIPHKKKIISIIHVQHNGLAHFSFIFIVHYFYLPFKLIDRDNFSKNSKKIIINVVA